MFLLNVHYSNGGYMKKIFLVIIIIFLISVTNVRSNSYDYLISLNPQTYNEICAEIYRDDLDEVRVKNIALVPAIKF